MNVILTHPELSQKYVGLYNLAILQIFSSTTMNEIFVMNDTINLTKDNKMLFKVTSLQEYKTTAVQRSSIELKTKTIEDEYNAMAQKRDNFLDFMRQNFPEIDELTLRGVIKKNVEEFIRLMEVKPKFPRQGNITIEVTLHDIIDKMSSTEFGSEHCVSEKVFMAILLAIQTLRYPTPNNSYTLVFKFSKSFLLGKSGLQRSSVICSKNNEITNSNDPVAKNIFKLNISKLLQIKPKAAAETEVVEKPLQSSETPPPPPLFPPVGENVSSTNDDSSSRVSDEEQRAAYYKLMEENIGREREYYIKSEPLKQYIYSKEALDEIPTNVSPTNVAYTKYENQRKNLTATIAELSSKFNIKSLEDAKKKLAELEAAVKAKTSDVEAAEANASGVVAPAAVKAKTSDVEAAEANASGVVAPAAAEANASGVVAPAAASDVVASDVVAPAAAETSLLPQAEAEAEAEELQPTPLTGDELFEKYNETLPKRDEQATNSDIKTYRQQVLDRCNEPDKIKICELLLISCDGSLIQQFKKLLFFKEIFASEHCIESKQQKCHTIFMKVAYEIIKLQESLYSGGSKSRRIHRRKPARKTTRKTKSKSKPKTHRHRRHSRVRKHKKYTSRRR